MTVKKKLKEVRAPRALILRSLICKLSSSIATNVCAYVNGDTAIAHVSNGDPVLRAVRASALVPAIGLVVWRELERTDISVGICVRVLHHQCVGVRIAARVVAQWRSQEQIPYAVLSGIKNSYIIRTCSILRV